MPDKTTPETLSWERARQIVITVTRSLGRVVGAEMALLDGLYGRVLAEDIHADRDYPSLRRSLRDGFAVHSADLPGTLKIQGETRAGEGPTDQLARSEALEIMTGAPVPDDADAVVMIEHVTRSGDTVSIDRSAEPGQFINSLGAEAKRGDILIPAGVRVDGSHVATLAMVGRSITRVHERPSVAILATGDEIVDVENNPAPHEIRNSNAYMLASIVRASGGWPMILPVARDTPETLIPLLKEGLEQDMLIVSGGVSAGKYDLVKPSLRKLGVTFHFERVRVQPGQPTAFGTKNDKVVFGLPGNPGSSLITFQLFARPALEIIGGQKEPLQPFLQARFEAPFKHKLGLTRFLPARLGPDGQSLRHIPWQGSSDIPALARANVFLVADHDREAWDAGDLIRVMAKP